MVLIEYYIKGIKYKDCSRRFKIYICEYPENRFLCKEIKISTNCPKFRTQRFKGLKIISLANNWKKVQTTIIKNNCAIWGRRCMN